MISNLTHLVNRLSAAMDSIKLVRDTLWDELQAPGAEPECIGTCTKPPAGWTCSRGLGHSGPCAASPSPLQPVLDAVGLVEVTPTERLLVALTERVDKLTRIVLDISPDVCAKHDLFGF